MDTPIIATKTRLIVTTDNAPAKYTIKVDGRAEETDTLEEGKDSINPLDDGMTELVGTAGESGTDQFVIDGSVESIEGDVNVQKEAVGIIPEWVVYATGGVLLAAIVTRILT